MTTASQARTPLGVGRTVGVVGTGTIGEAWVALFLSKGFTVAAYDPAAGAAARLERGLARCWEPLRRLGAPDGPPMHRLTWSTSAGDVAAQAEFIQENGPEDVELKRSLFAEMDEAAQRSTILASSSSGLSPSQIQEMCGSQPERIIIGHPFHPAHLIPLVEVVGGQRTSIAVIEQAIEFYRSLGKRPIRVRAELPGHVANRLQAALWREAYSLVATGAATVTDIDTAITQGPGLRWAAVGPFAAQHLSGGAGGIAHTLKHLGPPMAEWWDNLGEPSLDPDLIGRVVEQTAEELGAVSITDLAAARDRLLLSLLRAKDEERSLAT